MSFFPESILSLDNTNLSDLLSQRLGSGRKNAPSAKSSCQSEQGVQTMPKENLDVLEAVTVATEEVVPVGTEEMLFLRGRVDVLEEERKLLQETLASKEYVKCSGIACDQRLH